MAVLRPAFINKTSFFNGRTCRLSSISALTRNQEESKFIPKTVSNVLQVFVKKPLLGKNIHKDGKFSDLLRFHLKQILNNKTQNLLKSLDEKSLNEDNFVPFDKLFQKTGLREASNDEISRFFYQQTPLTTYVSDGGPFDYLRLYVSTKEESEMKKHGLKLILQIFDKPTQKRILILCRPSRNKAVILKQFINISNGQLANILPGLETQSNFFLKVLCSISFGASFGSLASFLVTELLYLPSNSLLELFAASTFLSSYLWGRLKDLEVCSLLDKCQTVYNSSSGAGNTFVNVIVDEINSKIFLDVVTVYSYLLKECETSKECTETSKYLRVDVAFRKKFKSWLSEELNVDLGESFDMDETLSFLEELEMIKTVDGSHFEVVPLEENLTNLQNRRIQLSDPLDD